MNDALVVDHQLRVLAILQTNEISCIVYNTIISRLRSDPFTVPEKYMQLTPNNSSVLRGLRPCAPGGGIGRGGRGPLGLEAATAARRPCAAPAEARSPRANDTAVSDNPAQ